MADLNHTLASLEPVLAAGDALVSQLRAALGPLSPPPSAPTSERRSREWLSVQHVASSARAGLPAWPTTLSDPRVACAVGVAVGALGASVVQAMGRSR